MKDDGIHDDDVYGGRSPIAVGARLRLVREALRLTQKAFSEKIGLASNTYNQLEKGRNYPSIDVLWCVCDALDEYMIDMNWLLGGDPSGMKHKFAQTLRSMHEIKERME